MDNSIMRSTQLKGDLMMVMVTMFWGASYLFMKMGLQSIQEYNLIALRFGFAFLVATLVFYRRFPKMDRKTILHGFLLGSLLFLSTSVVVIGLKTTSVSNAGFLFSLAVIFVPLLIALFSRKKPEKRLLISVCISMTGIGLLTLNETLSINTGDFLCILGALFYALHIIITGKVTQKADAISIGVLQLGFAGAWGLLFSSIFEKPQLPNDTESWMAILALSILCSAVGFIGQTVAQKYTSPTRTGLIFSLEPVFAAFFAFIFIGEILTYKGYVGAVLVLLGVLAAEINVKKPIWRRNFVKTISRSRASG
ncbi:DMT family transporter [Sporosarcina sp. ACRSM]|uniref:DMT family transporter n=1 Tax=Sporosarcina sp. ACRSM TaxID=2918216 RepID=UPI001EF4AAD9|nr:DMT family transporter [Sporosarcina sp. ACRSM]MCG7336912.1 DMT family transporter [Sporosarcina sp. ACRSM]